MMSKTTLKKLVLLSSGVAVITICIRIILQLHGIPYNVREMFLDNGSLIRIAVFSVAVLGPGISSALIGKKLVKSKLPYVSMPVWVFLSGMFSLLLLYGSVTRESISDIVGSSNIYWFVMNKKIWGDFGVKLFAHIDSPGAVSIAERIIRYLALYSPLVFSIAIFNAAFKERAFLRGVKVFVLYLIMALPWFFLCKVIAFDYSSTDNLNELIAREGAYGIGGGGYLYLLLALIALNTTMISHITMLRSKLLIFVFTVAAFPLGWFFIKNGLVSSFVKYSNMYSGIDFLLGPDRKHLLSQSALFVRWVLLQAGIVTVLAYGQRIALVSLEGKLKSETPAADKSVLSA